MSSLGWRSELDGGVEEEEAKDLVRVWLDLERRFGVLKDLGRVL